MQMTLIVRSGGQEFLAADLVRSKMLNPLLIAGHKVEMLSAKNEPDNKNNTFVRLGLSARSALKATEYASAWYCETSQVKAPFPQGTLLFVGVAK